VHLDPVLSREPADRLARPLVGGAIQQFLRDVDWANLTSSSTCRPERRTRS